ncbi:putative ATP binding protein [Tripterygium wilfordii]|uniref:Putative ATP binding protein n=1 Tax=Tripterygium wilfordii TaxID=458696 RepID=A0A7J7CHS2_TRIWF|nr:probable LRR receptor-like serine/threonine-protein kinase At4g29180 [Tripterygium wilfordii]KAF5733613.1 putative ATP binding protein [Tripterygium wilfordii]
MQFKYLRGWRGMLDLLHILPQPPTFAPNVQVRSFFPYNLRQFEFMKDTIAMASISATFSFLFFIRLSVYATLVEDLNNLHPPPDFNSTITTNCLNNPSLRYCNSSPEDLNDIFKSTIVASHLCNESKNPNCVESFPKIDLKNKPKIVPLYLSFNFFWKYCPLTILTIDISNNSMKGSFPLEILQCTQIQVLDLSHNGLTGEVPIQSLFPLNNLTVLNLSYNHFSESKISDAYFFERFNASCVIQSGILPNHRNYTIKAVILLILFPISLILFVGCFGWLCFVRPDYLPRMFQRRHKFTPSMIESITNEFSRRNAVAKGEGVDIYRGSLGDGTEVRIEIYNDGISRDNRRKFVEECKVLVQFCHKNIVQVMGWCDNQRLRAIVTEWTDGETVEMWLSDTAPPWTHRLKVMKGVLDGMCYLEEQWPEVEYDLRTSSVLLSSNVEPLISRFKVGNRSNCAKKIYKVGMFLLEIIANRRPNEDFDEGEADFIQHIRRHYPGSLQKVIDERMKLSENMVNQAKNGIGLGLMCIDQSSTKHPSLSHIFNMISKAYESCLALPFQHHSEDSRRHNRVPSV